MRIRVVHSESALHLRIGGGLVQRLQRQSHMRIVAATLNKIDDIGDSAVGEPELLLMEAAVFDAAGQIVHAFAFDNVRQDEFARRRRRRRRFAPGDPQKITHRESANFVTCVVTFELLKSDIKAALGFAIGAQWGNEYEVGVE